MNKRIVRRRLSRPVVLAVAQGRVEVRKTGETLSLVAGGQAVAALVPFSGAGIAATDAVVEIKPGLFEWTRTFAYKGRTTSGPSA